MPKKEPETAAAQRRLNLTQIFMASIFIGASGAVMDLSVDITSAVYEVVQKQPALSRKEAVKTTPMTQVTRMPKKEPETAAAQRRSKPYTRLTMSVDITSAVYEVVQKQPALSRKEAIRSGLNVGRAAMGTMTTTLLLAYSGGASLF